MPPPNRQLHWDIFCNVIDNFGDIGICWRLARQLTLEQGMHVRLWVDDLAAFGHLCPAIDSGRHEQVVDNIEVLRWNRDLADFSNHQPGDVVIEAFACHLPEHFVDLMASRTKPPVWVNLDYLSAEDWITGCHTLPSPHPRLPLTKYFFFPGFTEKTGGLLHENDLDRQRETFRRSREEQTRFWQTLGFPMPASDRLTISLFSYENPAIGDLLGFWAESNTPICCLLPLTRNAVSIEAWLGRSLIRGETIKRGALELRVLPFVAQEDFDRILWSSEMNFVRGEDSFVRAQWAERPFVWHIYQQEEEAHLAKLDAFLDRFTVGLSEEAATSCRALHHAWNDGCVSASVWQTWMSVLPEMHRHATNWANRLKKKQDLCSSLVHFCNSKL